MQPGPQFILPQQWHGKRRVTRRRLKVDQSGTENRGFRGKFKNPLNVKDAAVLEMIPGEIKRQIMPRGVGMHGKLPCNSHLEQISMRETLE